MVYCCDSCKFLFSRVGKIDQCPDCGSRIIRLANKAEQQAYQMLREEMNAIRDPGYAHPCHEP